MKEGEGLAEDKEDFVIDVVKEHTYQNQDEQYYDAYSKWRNDESNPYSYSYVHDTREYSYVAGQGYKTDNPGDAEQHTLKKCMNLLGLCMIVMLFFDALNYFVSYYIAGTENNTVYNSQLDNITYDDSIVSVAIFTVLTIFKYMVPMLIFKVKTKVPDRVVLPDSKTPPMFKVNAIIIMLMIVVIGRISGFVLSKVIGLFGIDTVYMHTFTGSSMDIWFVSFMLNCLIIPILCEVFFRGFVLQSLRQFGDGFAIVVSSIACALSFYDISYILFALLCSSVLGIFTVRTGSLKTAIYMHIVSTGVYYVMAHIQLISRVGIYIELLSYMFICAVAMVLYYRLNTTGGISFDLKPSSSQVSFRQKMVAFVGENSVDIWFVLVLVLVILGLRRI
ncbi:MAG: CPBP family intramembrane metalloprotease [Ruminococcus sp.]|nr:CPBP family intramembrane metalloprotease [Ruminococcus sp.]